MIQEGVCNTFDENVSVLSTLQDVRMPFGKKKNNLQNDKKKNCAPPRERFAELDPEL